MSAEMVIELDPVLLAPRVVTRAPARRHRGVGLVGALLLVLALAGAAPAPAPMWRAAGVLPPVPTDSVVELLGDHLYVSVGEHGQRITSGYAVFPLRRLWRTQTPDDVDARPRLRATHDALIVQVGKYTNVLDPATGRIRWTSAIPVQPLPGGRTGLLVAPEFRPGTEYDEASGDPGMLYFSPDGTSHTRPPERTVLHGVDLRTGTDRWSTTLPGAVYAAPALSTPATVVVVSSQRLDLLDADTGASRRQRGLSLSHSRVAAWSEVVGNLVLISSATDNGDAVSAYDLGSLEPRWQHRSDADNGNSRTCTGLPCERRRTTLVVLDPASGAPRWELGGSGDLVAWGSAVLEVDSADADPRPMRVLRRSTGATLVDLRGWQANAVGPADAPLVLSRPDPAGGTVFGELRPGESRVHELGVAETATSGCRADNRLVVCRSRRGIEVFTYRS